MVSNQERPLLKLQVNSEQTDRQKRSPISPPRPPAFSRDEQLTKLGPKFERLHNLDEMQLRNDPMALAPERVIVFELRSSIATFVTAAKKVRGLEFIAEELLGSDEDDKKPVMYLFIPDSQALKEILSLWQRWLNEGEFPVGYTPWRDVFATLRDLRRWGPQDRVDETDIKNFLQDLEETTEDFVAAEIELFYRNNSEKAALYEQEVSAAVESQGGAVIEVSRLDEIAYHAMLVHLPPAALYSVIAREPSGIAGLYPVMFIRPQGTVTEFSIVPAESLPVSKQLPLEAPISALLDGVPIAAHSWLNDHVIIEDLFELEPTVTVPNRKHGTAMASLIIHGDQNVDPKPLALPRKILHIPVLADGDLFPHDRLVVDIIYHALNFLISESNYKNDILIVNLSLGIKNCRFCGRMSPWARLLDRYAAEHGVLFVVSAGNVTEDFDLPPFNNRVELEDCELSERQKHVLAAIDNLKGDRRLLSPAETVNGVTVGAVNIDGIDDRARRQGRHLQTDPYGQLIMSNPSSAIGHGFGNSVKPDILMPGGREHINVSSVNNPVRVIPCEASAKAGLRVAAPPKANEIDSTGWTGATSAAAALATRTVHRIHDALEDAYGEQFLSLAKKQRAVLLKALLIHSARWPEETADFIREIVGPANGRQHVQQKDNIRRYLGYGIVDEDFSVSCALDRAIFWATGELYPEKQTSILIPIPQCFGGTSAFHRIAATLAWFTPVATAHMSYRTVRLKILEPDFLSNMAVSASSCQPDANQTSRGTVFSRSWIGNRAAIVNDNEQIELRIQREVDSGTTIDEPIAFGLALTIEMPGINQIYNQVRERLGLPVRP